MSNNTPTLDEIRARDFLWGPDLPESSGTIRAHLGNFDAVADRRHLLRLLDEAMRDAERYRWFKKEYSATWRDEVTGSDGVSWSPCWELRVYLSTSDEEQLDSAIDAAMEKQHG